MGEDNKWDEQEEELERIRREPGRTFLFIYYFIHHFHFPTYITRISQKVFPLAVFFLDTPRSQTGVVPSPGTCLHFLSRREFSIPTARRFSSNVASSCFLIMNDFRFFIKKSKLLCIKKKSLQTSLHSVRFLNPRN